jgi:hypothetical protein
LNYFQLDYTIGRGLGIACNTFRMLVVFDFLDPKNKNKSDFVAEPVHVKVKRQKGKFLIQCCIY